MCFGIPQDSQTEHADHSNCAKSATDSYWALSLYRLLRHRILFELSIEFDKKQLIASICRRNIDDRLFITVYENFQTGEWPWECCLGSFSSDFCEVSLACFYSPSIKRKLIRVACWNYFSLFKFSRQAKVHSCATIISNFFFKYSTRVWQEL